MHETVAPLQVGLSVVGAVGIGGAMLAVGNMLGRRERRATSSRGSLGAPPSTAAHDAARSGGPASGSERHKPTETVSDNRAKERFEIRVDGNLAGFVEYERSIIDGRSARPMTADELVDETGRQSFPASDPPSYWAGMLPSQEAQEHRCDESL